MNKHRKAKFINDWVVTYYNKKYKKKTYFKKDLIRWHETYIEFGEWQGDDMPIMLHSIPKTEIIDIEPRPKQKRKVQFSNNITGY